MGKFFTAAATFLCCSALIASAQSKLDETPRIGVLVPIGPPDYKVMLDAVEGVRVVSDGPFTYRLGKIGGVPVAVIIQPTDGDLVRSMGAQEMLHAFNIKALVYAGTSGAQLPKEEMGIGDIVLGAKNVNHAAYYLSPAGEIQAGTFNAMQPGIKHYGAIYQDPKLLAMLACSAGKVAAATTLPGFVEPVNKQGKPQIFYYGTQGTSTIWSDNKAYIEATRKVFHEIDEDGDWDSAFVATLFHVPFIEVSIISNSIYAFPEMNHGTPKTPTGEVNSHILAQRMSNRIAIELISSYGKQILAGSYENPLESPFPASYFDAPLEPHDLLKECR